MFGRILFYIYQKIRAKRVVSVAIATVVFLTLLFCSSRISLREDITQLIPSNDQAAVTTKVLEQVNFADKITIVISAKGTGTTNELYQFADVLTDSLTMNCAPYIAKFQGRFDEQNIQQTLEFVYNNLPLFLNQKDYQVIENRLGKDSIASIVKGNFQALVSPSGLVSRDFILKDPLGISFLALKKLQQLSIGDDFNLQNGYVVTRDGRNLLLFITPKLPANETDSNSKFVERLNSFKTLLNARFGSVASMTYFGATPVAVANAAQIKSDVRNTFIISVIGLGLILFYFYRSLSTLIIIFVPSLLGTTFALAITYFTKGNISAISLGISSILLGETTDYSVYVLTHLRNRKDVRLLYQDISKPVMLCALTTAISFLCLLFIQSEALQDLGFFATLGVMATALFTLIFIPHLYRPQDSTYVPKVNLIDRLGNFSFHKNRLLVASVILLSILCLFTYSKVSFNSDLSTLNYVPPELDSARQKLEGISDASAKSLYLVTHGDNYEAVLKRNSQLFDALENEKSDSAILNFSSIGGIVFSKDIQEEKIKLWSLFWKERKSEVRSKLIAEGRKYALKETAYDRFYELMDKSFESISADDYSKVGSLFLEEFLAQKNGFYTVSTLVKVPEATREGFIDRIEKDPYIEVIDRKRTNESLLGSLKGNFGALVNYSFIAIALVVLFAFRRIELVLASIFPVVISWVVTTGIMGLTGIQFNIINIIVCTLIFGVGVDYSIVMTQALQKEYTFAERELPIYRTSILLSAATTVLGIGILGIAQHPALRSIAFISVIGILSALIVTFVIQPIVFDFLAVRRTRKGMPPLRLRSVIITIFSFFYFGLGSIIMSILSVPLNGNSRMKGFRYLLSKFMKSVLYTNPFVSKKVINEAGETFGRPAILIANHSSFLDILVMGMLSRKLIFLVKDWVYNSPFFGPVVRKAGFYSVSQGLEGGLEHLKQKVRDGYSLVIFPEGTRSPTNQIRRFHKGAFYLAEQLGLDILPVVIHGTSEVLPKGDFMINDGRITVKFLNRISTADTVFGRNYAERTRRISAFFKDEYS
ncbi:MAG: glycerol acyltransferase, partial [Sphingobacteriales bacterium]